jgi:subtilisin family serine protease
VTPDRSITSTVPLTRGAYAMMVGTSQAAPQVAAAAGLALSANASLTAQEVVNRLRATARPLGSGVGDAAFGHGLLDAAAMVSSIPESRPAPAPAPTATPSDDSAGRSVGQLEAGWTRRYLSIAVRVDALR